MGAPNENGKSWAFGNLNKTIHVHEGSYRVSPFKLNLSQVVCPGLLGSGNDGAQYLLLLPFVKTVSRAFSPITSRTALPRRSGIHEKRKRN